MASQETLEAVAFALHCAEWAADFEDQISFTFEVVDACSNVAISWKDALASGKHSGDCTNEIHMCLVCWRERMFEGAEKLLTALAEGSEGSE